jgi:hypothetical protein
MRGRLRRAWRCDNVGSLVPFAPEDGPQLRRDPLPVVDKFYPGSGDLLRERGVRQLAPLREYFPMDHAADRLIFRPVCNFDRWLAGRMNGRRRARRGRSARGSMWDSLCKD